MATGEKERGGQNLEKVGPTFTSCGSVAWRKIAKKTLIVVCAHFREWIYAFWRLKVILLISECSFINVAQFSHKLTRLLVTLFL